MTEFRLRILLLLLAFTSKVIALSCIEGFVQFGLLLLMAVIFTGSALLLPTRVFRLLAVKS